MLRKSLARACGRQAQCSPRPVVAALKRSTQVLSLDRHSAGPELFEPVVVALRGVEEVDDDGAVVEQNPVAVLVAFESEAAVAALLLQHVVNGVAHGPELAVTR